MLERPVVVLGGGPGGASAALWCRTLGLPVVLLERGERLGGQLHAIHWPMDNVPGAPDERGGELARRLAEQLARSGAIVRTGVKGALEPAGAAVRCEPGGDVIDAAAVVIATGVRRRLLDVPGARQLAGKGVLYNIGPAPELLRGQRVVIVGGGDDAFDHARLAAPHASRVTVVYRGERATARRSILEEARAATCVEERPRAAVIAIEGDGRVERVRVRGPQGEEELEADAVYVCIGPVPNVEGLGVRLDARGYIEVDGHQRTSRPGVWAAGDVCCPGGPTIATALGQGAVAAKSISAALDGAEQAACRGPSAPKDRLRIDGLVFPARIGVYPSERGREQTLTLSVEVDVDAARAAAGDAIRNTIDYAAVAKAIEEMLAERHINLVETVAERVAMLLLDQFPIQKVRVRVTKPGVPQPGSSATVEVERSRD